MLPMGALLFGLSTCPPKCLCTCLPLYLSLFCSNLHSNLLFVSVLALSHPRPSLTHSPSLPLQRGKLGALVRGFSCQLQRLSGVGDGEDEADNWLISETETKGWRKASSGVSDRSIHVSRVAGRFAPVMLPGIPIDAETNLGLSSLLVFPLWRHYRLQLILHLVHTLSMTQLKCYCTEKSLMH